MAFFYNVTRRYKHAAKRVLLLSLCTSLISCSLTRHEQGIGPEVDWSRLQGWASDAHAESWPAFLQSCAALRGQSEKWREICVDAELLSEINDANVRAFYEAHFRPHKVLGESGAEGLITGYYEPVLNGSLTPDEHYKIPVYRPPEDLVRIDLGPLYPELEGKPLRGRFVDKRVIPYFDRRQIQDRPQSLAGHELLWVDDPVALFFLQIQGSGRIRLPDGDTILLGYADQNGHPYVPIGRWFIDQLQMEPEDINMHTIRDWLAQNPHRIDEILNLNPSYIFFQKRENTQNSTPIGSLRVPLTPQRSIAVDRKHIALGLPVWLETTLPAAGEKKEPDNFHRLMLAQDTGGAIRGATRADVFFGQGSEAERIAGYMKQTGRLYVLLPQERNSVTPQYSAQTAK